VRPDRRRCICYALTGSIISSPLRLLLGARGLRGFGDGFVAVLLPVYLTALGFSPLEVGALAGTALFGSALLTLAVGFLGVRYDHRLLLISSAGLMTATGVALSIVDSYALLLVVAFIGSVINEIPARENCPADSLREDEVATLRGFRQCQTDCRRSGCRRRS
jgi:hypothetical protein